MSEEITPIVVPPQPEKVFDKSRISFLLFNIAGDKFSLNAKIDVYRDLPGDKIEIQKTVPLYIDDLKPLMASHPGLEDVLTGSKDAIIALAKALGKLA